MKKDDNYKQQQIIMETDNFSGLSASIFQFSPIVEHFLQSHFLRNQSLPILTVDAKTPNPNETPDLMKVVRMQDEKKDIVDLSTNSATSSTTSNCPQPIEFHGGSTTQHCIASRPPLPSHLYSREERVSGEVSNNRLNCVGFFGKDKLAQQFS